MKNLFFFSLLAIILVSCDGFDPINPPDPPIIVKDSFIVKGIAHENGKIYPSEKKVEKGSYATFSIVPNAGYEIDYLLDDGYKLPAIDTYTVKDVISDDTFEVAFKKDPIVWPLINILWNVDSTYVEHKDGTISHYKESGYTESFSSDGFNTEISNGRSYVNKYYLDKVNLTITISDGFNTTILKIEKLNESKMILSFINGVQKWYLICSNMQYKNPL